MKQLSPFPLESNDEGAKKQKRAILASLKWGVGVGKGGPDVTFILSKIVASNL